MAKPDPDLIAKLNACADHARELVRAGNAVLASGQPNIAYHLGVLALEEIGKRELIAAETVAADRDVPPTWPSKHALDHQQKLGRA